MALLRDRDLTREGQLPVDVPLTADDWLVFHGEASPAEARIYVQVRPRADSSGCKLTGSIQGPMSAYARTLQATTRFVGQPQEAGIRAQAILPDPCFWTPALPYLYSVQLRLEHAGHTVWTDQRTFGIRRFGARGERFYFDAQNWVLRGSVIRDPNDVDWAAYREQDLALVVDSPTEDFCGEADRQGLLVVARNLDAPARCREQLLIWQRHPSVAIVLFDGDIQLPSNLHAVAPNALFAARLRRSDQSLPAWAEVAWVLETAASQQPGGAIPRVIERATGNSSPAAARSACDALQRDLAGLEEAAGFVAGM